MSRVVASKLRVLADLEMRFIDTIAEHGKPHQYRVIAVNTVGLKSK
jgi:hypothetical protein